MSYKHYRSLAFNIGLFKKMEKQNNVLWNIYSQSSKFRFCNKKGKKKKLQGQGNGLLFVSLFLFFLKA